ncbi:zinc dependent phospholipase C family protein [Collinsella sp. AGMB00827]|uniref:Zinc dependent phospholipase C family protein n=1 Tax=Collinsella ureilytica TaxID=2869515 RepID=A0ABS7MKQ2_9ACTN|nr:zinc dependent phospholipase C family protein [Collinsella urealyticum]MBY4797618.1 zinc dependent phospholipase C family protein [Collinsella urealyticum]
MPALITHRLFGEESITLLPEGLIASADDRSAFLIANQGPDPFFFRFRTLKIKDCMSLAHRMHASFITQQFMTLRDGVSRLPAHDAGTGRAFALGLLSHYILDRTAHPFVYAQQWGIQEADPEIAAAGNQIHAIIESDLDVLMLQRKRSGATTENLPPASLLTSGDRVDKIGGVLMSYIATKVYGLDVNASQYGGAVADMNLIYRLIEPAGSPRSQTLAALERRVAGFSLLGGLAHRVTTKVPRRAGNLDEYLWENPFTHQASRESFPAVFDRALAAYQDAVQRFIEGGDLTDLTQRLDYSGCRLAPDEQAAPSDEPTNERQVCS